MTAKEMFEKLKYHYEDFKKDNEIQSIQYVKYEGRWCKAVIYFDLRFKTIESWDDCGGEYSPKPLILGELKAINKQVEELGWN